MIINTIVFVLFFFPYFEENMVYFFDELKVIKHQRKTKISVRLTAIRNIYPMSHTHKNILKK
jgi:hypothetical protein